MSDSVPKPTIKGLFVNSHITAVRNQKGDEGVKKLAELFGKPLTFKNEENIPVSEEVRLISCAVDVLSPTPIAEEQRAFESGRLHFRNFTTTPFGKIIFSLFRYKFKLIMMRTQMIAGHVFQHVKFSSFDLGPTSVRVVMENNDYPIEHFQGLFSEWMAYAGLNGTVLGHESAPNTYEYTLKWDN